MPRQNRVTPYGELIAVPDRGMFWGNRGALLDREGRLARYSRGQAWAICFLDEATGLAAGHRVPAGSAPERTGRLASPGHSRRTSPSWAVSWRACSRCPSMSADMWVSTVRRAVSSSRCAARSAWRRWCGTALSQ